MTESEVNIKNEIYTAYEQQKTSNASKSGTIATETYINRNKVTTIQERSEHKSVEYETNSPSEKPFVKHESNIQSSLLYCVNNSKTNIDLSIRIVFGYQENNSTINEPDDSVFGHRENHSTINESDDSVNKPNFSDRNHYSSEKDICPRGIIFDSEVNSYFSCSYCYFVATETTTLNFHIETVHKKIADIRCKICEYICLNQQDLQRHMKLTHDKMVLNCGKCDYFCFSKGTMRHHVSLHKKGEPILKCNLCHFKASKIDRLERHMKSLHYIQDEFFDIAEQKCL